MTNTTTGFCGVILATFVALQLPTTFGVDAFNKANRILEVRNANYCEAVQELCN